MQKEKWISKNFKRKHRLEIDLSARQKLFCEFQTPQWRRGWEPGRRKGRNEPIVGMKEEMKDELREDTIRTQKRQLQHIFPDQDRDDYRAFQEKTQNETKAKIGS